MSQGTLIPKEVHLKIFVSYIDSKLFDILQFLVLSVEIIFYVWLSLPVSFIKFMEKSSVLVMGVYIMFGISFGRYLISLSENTLSFRYLSR